MIKEVITIVGSTGTIGSELVGLLSAAGVPVRAILRELSRKQQLPGVAWLQADLSEQSLLDCALAGTDRLFLLTGNEPGFGQTQISIIAAAERLGVSHIVKLSALGASERTKSPLAHEHWMAEQALRESTMDWTILRPHVFMQNWLGEIAESVRTEGKIYAAIGQGKVPFIDARDIAAVAAEALVHPEKHRNKQYILTGSQAVGYETLASALSKATGSPVTYEPLSMEKMRERMENQGISASMIDSYLALAAYQKAGGPTAQVSTSVKEILGREARTVADFASDYYQRFK